MRKIRILIILTKKKNRHHCIIGVDSFLYQNTCTCMFKIFLWVLVCLAYLVFKRTVTFQCLFLRLLNIGQYCFYTKKNWRFSFFLLRTLSLCSMANLNSWMNHSTISPYPVTTALWKGGRPVRSAARINFFRSSNCFTSRVLPPSIALCNSATFS